jgi:hypothetical protein
MNLRKPDYTQPIVGGRIKSGHDRKEITSKQKRHARARHAHPRLGNACMS